MTQVGASWNEIAAAILTHTHSDHVVDPSLRSLQSRGIPLYCHEGHCRGLERMSGFGVMNRAGLIRHFDDRPFLAPQGLRIEPIELSHDGGPTFGFRFESQPRRRGRPVSAGYVADTGCWTDRMVDALADVDLLGVEFNHDVDLQKRSGRAHLI